MQDTDEVQPTQDEVIDDSSDTSTDEPAATGLVPEAETTENQASVILNLEEMINGYLADIDRIRGKLKSQKEMFKQTFEQDKDFNVVSEEQKAVKRKQAEVKQRIEKTDAVVATKMTIQDMQSELKEAQQSLSDYLNRYIQLTQATSFTGPGGEVLSIVRSAKLVKKKD